MSEKKKKPPEPDQPRESESSGACDQEPEKLRQELESLRKEKDEVFGRLQRVYADYANFQKRAPKNIADTVEYEKERFLRSFLPILDNFDRTLREARSAQNVEAVIKGVAIIRDQMLTVLKSQGVEPMETLHEKFDPARHEAMLRRSEPDQEDDIVLEEFQKGYTLSGRIIRPSRVAINKIQASAEPAAGRAANSQQRTQPTEAQAPQQGTEAAEAPSEQDRSTE
jgi:molecular chaperone GrpE